MTIFIPKENEKDIEDIPATVKKDMKIILSVMSARLSIKLFSNIMYLNSVRFELSAPSNNSILRMSLRNWLF